MAEKTILIIGAGLAGLSTGCYAQMNGYRTRIVEQHTRPGGVCTAWKRNGYTIDGCIHWLMGAAPGCAFHRLYEEVGALDGNALLPLQHLCRFVDEGSGQCLEITADLDRLAANMRSLSPADGASVDELLSAVRSFGDFDVPVNAPRALMGPLGGLQRAWQMRPWLSRLRRYSLPAAAFSQQFQHPFLRWAIAHVFVPQMPASLLCILLAQLAAGRLATVEGGSLAFALAVSRRYRELGGQIVYGAPVQEILVEAGGTHGHKVDRATGVRLADGSEHHADIVISAADGHSTIFGMLGGAYVSAETREQYQTWPTFSPLLVASYGVGREYPDWPTVSRIRPESSLTIGGREVDHLSCRVYRGDAFAPPGKAVVQARFAADFDHWLDLQHRDRAAYEAQKARVADQILERLESYLPGISAAVDMADVATPFSFWRYTRNWRGASRGWLPTAGHVGKPLPKTLPGLEGFYMAGQWVEPGGGIPTILASGRQVVQLLCHRERVPFVAASG
jgi:phytoene dehydrogenase-like protein